MRHFFKAFFLQSFLRFSLLRSSILRSSLLKVSFLSYLGTSFFLLNFLSIFIFLSSCSALKRPDTEKSSEGGLFSFFQSRNPAEQSSSKEDFYEDEEPLSLPPGMGPKPYPHYKIPSYTNLTPGSLKAFDWPVDEARLSRGYFLKDPRGRKKRPHLGIDLAYHRGTPIYASHSGKVIYVGSSFKGYGRMVMIENEDGDFATLYAHLLKSRVRQGMWVKQGDHIGDMGNTGRSTGTHLHFEIRTIQGTVDPLEYLPKIKNTTPLNLYGKTFSIPDSEEQASEEAKTESL
jgi:murein DD-endopeptidase MepM/ murein hydrolase activator NlpD